MDFKDSIKQIGDKIAKQKDNIFTEEATKMAFILPFLQSLGYDIFDTTEVIPEYICDIPTKKGEKIDYAIFKDGQPMILIECKHWAQNLDLHDGQLLRYFTVSKARFGILTNGINYRFYTDLVSPNVMDEKPFFEIKIDDLKEQQIEKLKEFQKSTFNLDDIIQTANELKYTNELRQIIENNVQEPTDDFAKFFAKIVYPSHITSKILEQFKGLVKKTFSQYINDEINERLKSALRKQEQDEKLKISEEAQTNENNEIKPTDEEIEFFLIVKAICRMKVEGKKITYREARGHQYFSVLFEDSQRNPICRFYSIGNKKQVGIFDTEKKAETKIDIISLDDVYKLSEYFLNAIEFYSKSSINSVQ
ncbi:MAG TPA: type I restriction endonuclease [Bacteroidia bacterium]|nr:type I restriction endonuclease [Bacteroidia bacterium]